MNMSANFDFAGLDYCYYGTTIVRFFEHDQDTVTKASLTRIIALGSSKCRTVTRKRPNTSIPNGYWFQHFGEAVYDILAEQNKVLTYEQLDVTFRCLDQYKRTWPYGAGVRGTWLEVARWGSPEVIANGHLHRIRNNALEALKH